jgi:hypothetical protein
MNDDKNQMDFVGHIVHLEDAQNVPLPTFADEKTLTDNELERAGLVKTSAYVRTKKSKNALRIEKHKDKKLTEKGVKQLNIEVPGEHREVFKALAKELATTGAIQQEHIAYFTKLVSLDKYTTENEAQTHQTASESDKENLSIESIAIGKKCAKIVAKGGFKSWLLKKIV